MSEQPLLRAFAVGPVQANCYLLAHDSRAVLIDPGAEGERLLGELARQRLTLEAVWLTHAHFDHLGALADVVAATGVPVHLHPADAPLLATAAEMAARWGIAIAPPPAAFHELRHEGRLQLGQLEVVCVHTPGHAPGHVAFHLPAAKVVLSGDTLFHGSIGRTDLPLADHATLLRSIRERLLTLPPDTRVLPGHGPATSVGREAASNPFLR